MAIFQSPWGAGQKIAPVSREAGGAVVEKYEFTISANLASTDIVELGVLPAYHTVVDATLVTGALGAGVTADIGIMSGTLGSVDVSRTSGNELFAGAANNTVVRMNRAAGFQIAPVEADRSIGLKVSGAVTASNQKVTLILTTKQ